jgi:excisionase family DNA binding protein
MVTIMSEELHTVEAAAARLKLHAKTVLRMIREGRLKATRIGKSYRILGSELDRLAGAAARPSHGPKVTCIAELPDISREEADRLTNLLQAALMGRGAGGDPVQSQAAYDPARRQLKLVIIAAPGDAAALLRAIDTVLEAPR